MHASIKMALLAILYFLFANTLSAQTAADTTTVKTDSIEARFPGGAAGWANYLQHNLRAEVGAENLKVKKHQTVQQTATVSFLVNTDGKISEVKVTNPAEVHPKLAEEAVRVIKEGPDWLPATIAGKPVVYRQKQNITFVVSYE